MIVCPKCRHQEIDGALFCGECGAPLVVTERVKTNVIGQTKSGLFDQREVKRHLQDDGLVSTSLSIVLVDSGQTLHLEGRPDYSLGRASEAQPILPDVDFSPYDAYAQGVSRLHASLKWVDSTIYIMDLGSSNGTRVNGQKIPPHIDFPINHGDIIILGRLKIQILLQSIDEKR